jgi:integrase
MRSNRSKYAHARYPNLYNYPDQPCWIFRKYSSAKGDEFFYSTGFDATPQNAATAYRVGVEKFNDWLGAFTPTDATTTVKELGRKLLAAKRDNPNLSDATVRSVENQLENHVIPAFGGLKPGQVTKDRWLAYERAERKRPRELALKDGTVKELPPRRALFNTRKTLVEILTLAKREGLIKGLPELPLSDPESEPPRSIPKADILRIIRFAGRIAAHEHRGTHVRESRHGRVPIKLLTLIMWKQGARPNEVLQYRWEMIHWNEGTHGYIHIPAAISKNRRARQIPINPQVARILRFLEPHAKSPWLFPSPVTPGERIRDYDKAWNTVVDRLGIDFTIYNLRDTFITQKLKEGLSAVFIAKYVDNSAQMIERRYAVQEQEVMEDVAGTARGGKGARG